MSLASIIGIVAGGMVAVELAVAVITILRQRWLYPRRAQACFAENYTPRCAIVMPTKGAPPELAGNLAAHLRLDYPHFQLICAVEAENDPGVPLIRELAGCDPRVRLVVAGLATRGCQQNHNMIAGVAAAGDVEILAFADNDFPPPRDWLRRLVRPLSAPTVTVSSGYRWLVAPRGTFGELAHVAMNMAMYAHFSALNELLGRGLWGGSFALRRIDYEALGVEARWSEAISDDMTLTDELVRRGRRSMLAADLLIATEEVLPTTRAAARWYSRQVLNMKAYDFPTWAGLLSPAYLLAGALLVWPLVAVILTSLLGGTFVEWGGGAGLGFWLGEMVVMALISTCGPTKSRGWLVVLAPFLRAAQVWGWAWSIPLRAIVWAGVYYRFDRRGRVVELRRPA